VAASSGADPLTTVSRTGGTHRTQASVLDARWTLTCGYGYRGTGWTRCTDLRIRRLGVRVPPIAPTSEAPHLVREGPFSFLWEPRWSHRRVSATEAAVDPLPTPRCV
jgi:hypothetical protein